MSKRFIAIAASAVSLLAARAGAATAPGYIYSPQVLSSLTQSCVAVGPGGTFAAIGPAFVPNAQAVVFVQESGAARLVAFGFNSVGDCIYDPAADALYVTDNAGSGELAGAVTGDTVFRVPSASTASALTAQGLELLPANSLPMAAGVAVDASGNVYVANAAGGGAGAVTRIAMPAITPTLFVASGLDFAAGLAFDAATGDLFASETLTGGKAQVRRYDSLGAPLGIFAGPSFGFGSYDIAFNTDGRLLATGAFGGDVVSFNGSGMPSPFASGLTFTTGVSVNAFTGRVEMLSATFIPTAEDRSIHRFTPIDRLVPGSGPDATECLNEFYGAKLVAAAPGKAAKKAICTDGDDCDADGVKDDRCVFPIGFCLDVPDPAFPACSGGTIESYTVLAKPNPLDVAAANSALQAALPVSAPACFYTNGVTVPVQIVKSGKKAGKGKVSVKAKAGTSVDKDSLSLVCNPAS